MGHGIGGVNSEEECRGRRKGKVFERAITLPYANASKFHTLTVGTLYAHNPYKLLEVTFLFLPSCKLSLLEAQHNKIDILSSNLDKNSGRSSLNLLLFW